MSRDDFIHKATLLSDQQKHSECLELCEKEIAIDDKNANALLHKSACLIKLKKPEDAIACCDKILNGNAFFIYDVELSTAFTLNNKGHALSMLRKFEDALECHDKALAIDDKNEKIYVNKALALGGLGKFEESLKNSEHAISINQNYAMAWNNAAYALHKLGRHEDALEYVEKALELDPADTDTLDSKRAILESLGRTS